MGQDDTNTSGSAGDPMDVMRSMIDLDIVRLENIPGREDSIRALKSRRNELSPISRFPAEILCYIFSHSRRISWYPRRPVSWTNFSQVSRHWRLLALGATELWTNIPLSNPRWAKEMLIRSKMAKLTIRFGDYDLETIRSCLYEMNRVEEIDIALAPGMILEEIFRDSPKSAPQLRTLRIRSLCRVFSIHEDFLYDTECLQRVELINCKISWDSRLLTGLTCLTLHYLKKANSSINQILHALERMPALIDLDLFDSIPDESEGPFTYPDVDLPCLRRLDILSGVGALTTVLRHITFPNSAILRLTCEETRSTQIDFSNFFFVLATKFLSSLVVRSLSLQGYEIRDYTHVLKYHLWTTPTIQDCLFSEISQYQLKLVLTWPSQETSWPSIQRTKALTCGFDAMNLPFLTQLQISTLYHIDSETWVNTFGSLPLLERVCVHSHVTHGFLRALVYKTKAAEKSNTAYRNVSFPKLRYLYLQGSDFDSTLFDMLLVALWRDMKEAQRYKCFVWPRVVATVSRAMTLKGLKKLLLMLSGMEQTSRMMSLQVINAYPEIFFIVVSSASCISTNLSRIFTITCQLSY